MPTSTQIQTVIFKKAYYTKAQAKSFAKKHGWKTSVDEFEGTYHLRQQDPKEFQPKSFRTIDITTGVQAVIGRPKQNPQMKAHSISAASARLLAGDIGLTSLKPHELEAFRRGLEVEHEHFGSVKGNWNTVAKIVADHLDEDPDYYTKLDYWEAYASEVDLEDL